MSFISYNVSACVALTCWLDPQPYFPVPKGETGTQHVLRAVAPRRVWPAIAFGASVACWYEHLGRTVSIVLCKHHRLWELAFRVFTLYR